MANPPPQDRPRSTWQQMTLGETAERGDPIIVWCNNKACGCAREHGRQYRAALSVADLAAYVERYGASTTFEAFRARLRCRHCGSGDVSTIVDTPYVPPARTIGPPATVQVFAA
jgi:hypothetical protein